MLSVFFLWLRRRLLALFQPLSLIATGWAWVAFWLRRCLCLIAGLLAGFGLGLIRRSVVIVHPQPPVEREPDSKINAQLALQETKEMYARGMGSVEVLANKATALLSNSGLLLTLFGVLQIALLESNHPDWYKAGLLLVFGLYIITVILLLAVLAPGNYQMAFVADWNGVDHAIRDHSPEDALVQLLANYLGCIQHNDAVHHRNIVRYKWAVRLFGFTVILLVALSLFAQR